MESQARPVPFVGLSGILHIAAFFLITVLAADLFQKPEMPPTVEIEILSSSTVGAPAPKLEEVPAPSTPPPAELRQAEAPSALPVPLESIATEDVIVKAQPLKTTAPKIAKTPKLRTARQQVQTSYRSPAPLQPVAVPNLETVDLEDAPVVQTAQLDRSVVDEDLDQVSDESSKAHQKDLAALKQDFENDEKAVAAEQLGELSQAEKQIEEQDSKLAAISAQQKRENQAKLNQALAAEAEAQRAADHARSIREAAAAKAKAQQEAQQAALRAGSGGHGQGGNQDVQNQAAGSVRGIEDLRQKPGNARPQYDEEERFQRQQGEVVFVAYVTRDGNLKDFKLLQSSGHRSLDYKTLKALKGWKFYPGQEGIVEIPFRWDLKGGPQEKSARLRGVSVGQN